MPLTWQSRRNERSRYYAAQSHRRRRRSSVARDFAFVRVITRPCTKHVRRTRRRPDTAWVRRRDAAGRGRLWSRRRPHDQNDSGVHGVTARARMRCLDRHATLTVRRGFGTLPACHRNITFANPKECCVLPQRTDCIKNTPSCLCTKILVLSLLRGSIKDFPPGNIMVLKCWLQIQVLVENSLTIWVFSLAII